MRKQSIYFLLTFALIISALTSIEAAYLTDVPQTLKQPNGEIVHCFATGDEFYSWLHDGSNFTIIQNHKTGYYVYADKLGEELIPTAYIVNKVNPELVGLKKGLNYSPERMKQMRDSFLKSFPKTKGTKAPSTGVINNIVVFIRFSDESEFTDNISTYNNKFNNTSTDSNSMYNYFKETSYNQLAITSTFYPQTVSTVVSFQDSFPRNYYKAYDSITNPTGYTGGNNGSQRRMREHALLENAVDFVNSQIPGALDIDGDLDGFVDNVCFIIYGSPEGWASLLWPHRWSLYSTAVYIHGVQVMDYNFQLQSQVTVNVLCHEMFHSLGSPDLYHYSFDGISPAGRWDIMCTSLNPPEHMSAYMKYRYGIWINDIPEIDTNGTYWLKPLISPTNNCYKIPSPCADTEFFVVEYRRKTGIFEGTLPGSGLLVYRINAGQDGEGNADGPPDEVYLYRPGGTLDSNGTTNSANFSSNVGRTSINDITNPNSFLSDGSPGGLNIYNIGSVGDSISFHVMLSGIGTEETQDLAFALSPNLFIGKTAIQYSVPIKAKVSLKLYNISGRIVQTLVNEEKTPGNYKVNPTKNLPSGIYFAKFSAGNFRETKKLVLIK
ncbi:MAG: M6 family metalloprotease domain-containing protein [bacterium]